MIWQVIANLPLQVILAWRDLFVAVDRLPLIFGVDVDSIFVLAMENFKVFRHLFPPFDVMLALTIAVFGTMLIAKVLRMIPFFGKVIPQE